MAHLKFHVRKANERDDFNPVEKIYFSTIGAAKRNVYGIYQPFPLTKDMFDAGVKRGDVLIAQSDSSSFKSKTKAHEILGVSLTLQFFLDTFVNYLIVDPNKGRLGIGSAMIKKILQCSEEINNRAVTLITIERFLPFYQRHGFQKVDREKMSQYLYCWKLFNDTLYGPPRKKDQPPPDVCIALEKTLG